MMSPKVADKVGCKGAEVALNRRPLVKSVYCATAIAIAAFSFPIPSVAMDRSGVMEAIAAGERLQQEATPCAATGTTRRAYLQVDGDRVVGDHRLDEIVGYAREARTTGGLGGKLHRVSHDGDWSPQAHEKPVSGSLRAAIEAVIRSREPGWIVFDLPPATRIQLKAPLKLPDNITLDGGCADVTLEAPSKIGLVYVIDRTNVLVRGLGFRKTDYVPGRPGDDDRDCITINGRVDRVAVVHNDFASCGDGVIDITVSHRATFSGLGRLTFAFNRVRDHDKVMLFGTFTCESAVVGYGAGCPQDGRPGASPALYLTLFGNVFSGTAQRHPRVFGRVMAHISENVIVYSPLRHLNGGFSASSGVLVTNGARALVERNVFVSEAAVSGGRPPLAVWTTTTPGAHRMPSDYPGSIREAHNVAIGTQILAGNAAGDVADPPYALTSFGGLAKLGVARRIACIAFHAGRYGVGGAGRCDGEDDAPSAATMERAESGVSAASRQNRGTGP